MHSDTPEKFQEEILNKDLELLNSKILQSPQDPLAFYNKANILRIQGNYEEAVHCYQKAIQYMPDHLESHYNLGLTYYLYNKLDLCLEKLLFCLQLNENLPLYWFIGKIYYHQRRYSEALHFLSRSLQKNEEVNPDHYLLIGNIYYILGEYKKALNSYLEILKIDNQSFDICFAIAITLEAMNQLDDSINYYKKAHKLNKNNIQTLFRLNFLLRQTCAWFDDCYLTGNELGNIIKTTTADITEEIPWICAISIKNDEICSLAGRKYSQKLEAYSRPYRFYPKLKADACKIKIGYLSSDFCTHATSHLMSEIFMQHDKNSFEIYTFYSGNIFDEYTKKIKNSSNYFFNIYNMTDYEAAKLIYDLEIDILIELKGYTQNNRFGIAAYYPCPIQIHYLGFAGSLGANFIDYFIADEITVPQENLQYFREEVLYLPHTYQVNDRNKPTSKNHFCRDQIGLQNDQVVFCCFNQPYKIDLETINAWIKILLDSEKSVLLLLDHNPIAKKNLLGHFKKNKIKCDRIVFLPNLPIPDHLARLKNIVDIALDCFICNGHTTTSDALYANVPVITVKGCHFASRVSESLLKAVGMHELICNDQQEYINMAIILAKDVSKINMIKKKLKTNLKSSPLFNIKKFTGNFEELLLKLFSNNINPMVVAENNKKEVLKLNIGCGFNLLEGWSNLDSQKIPGAIQFDLNDIPKKKLSFAENSVDEFLMSHVLEHLPNPLPIMEELYRIAKPNSEMIIRVPYGSSDDAFEDPTHLRQYFMGSFLYFSQPAYFKADYGYRGDWQVKRIDLFISKSYSKLSHEALIGLINQSRNVVYEMVVTLKAIKPSRPSKRELQEVVQPNFHWVE